MANATLRYQTTSNQSKTKRKIKSLNDYPGMHHYAVLSSAELFKYPLITQVNDASISPKAEAKSPQFVVLPIGINIGKRNVLQSASVKGYEDGEKAVDFPNWLVPFQDITTALNLTVSSLPNGELEIKGVGLIKRIKLNELTSDPELGLTISIAKIEELLQVRSQFDIAAYSIILEPPWLNFKGRKNYQPEAPVIVEGLPVVKSPNFTFSTVGQKVNISGRENSQELTNQGSLNVLGTVLKGSWFSRINQPNLLDSTTWKLEEGQYLNRSDFHDYVIGSQPTFWRGETNGDYWGFTTIKRFGFKADNLNNSSFTPSQSLQTSTINRIIEGAAKPGTLVQLVSGNDNLIFGEILVDSSGIYRFDNVPINSQNYRVLLYVNGQLTSTPIEKKPIFLSLPGQLTQGTSSLIVSSGMNRETRNNDFFGDLNNVRGGVAYRHGVTDSLTLGGGIIYDQSLLGLGEVFYQPNNFPFKLAVSALKVPDKFKYNANLEFRPSSQLNLNLSSNEQFQSFNFNWNAAKFLSINSSGNNLNDIINLGFNVNQNIGKISTYSSLKIDNKQQLDWNSNLRWRNLSARASPTGIGLELNYEGSIFSIFKLPEKENLILSYETNNSSNKHNSLLTLKWKYQSPYINQRRLWDFDLGYGIGSQGSGLLASVSTFFIPGLSLRLRYDGISMTSDTTSYRLEIGSVVNFSPNLRFGDSQSESLRSEGGIFIQPFLDKNNNGIRDNNEEIYTQDMELLLILNNKKFNPSLATITKQGVLFKVPLGIYRLDLDPAGYPLDWKPVQNAYAMEIVAGSYITISVPFVASYTLAGTVKDAEGKPIVGARVEAIDNTKSSFASITNSSGVFYLEQLRQGTYELKVNNKSVEPNRMIINSDSPTLQELNLKLPNL